MKAEENLCRAIVPSAETVTPLSILKADRPKRLIRPRDQLTLSGKKGKAKVSEKNVSKAYKHLKIAKKYVEIEEDVKETIDQIHKMSSGDECFVYVSFPNVEIRLCDLKPFFKEAYLSDTREIMMGKENEDKLQMRICQLLKNAVGKEIKYIHFPLISAGRKDASKGDHWTLLLLDIETGMWHFLNSMGTRTKLKDPYFADA